jgi:hypothetical protein
VSPPVIGLIVFVCVFGGALAGMKLRTVLPEHHLSEASKDVVKLVTGLVATLAALVLGLLIASAKSSFEAVNEGFRQSAARIVLLDRTLAQYGSETQELRALLKKGFAVRIEQLFPKDSSRRQDVGSAQGTAAIEGLEQVIRALKPQNDVQRSLQARALEITASVAQARWMGIEAQENVIPPAFLMVLVFWLAAMFASFGLFAPRNAMTITALGLGALSLAAAVFLIEEMNDPLQGVIAVSSAPMYKALGFLGQ